MIQSLEFGSHGGTQAMQSGMFSESYTFCVASLDDFSKPYANGVFLYRSTVQLGTLGLQKRFQSDEIIVIWQRSQSAFLQITLFCQ